MSLFSFITININLLGYIASVRNLLLLLPLYTMSFFSGYFQDFLFITGFIQFDYDMSFIVFFTYLMFGIN